MKVSEDKVVSLSYTLEVDGKVIETTTAEQPLQFIYGIGYLLPKFEENIAGKAVGDSFDFVLSPKDGYGEKNPDAIVDLPKNIFMIDGKIEEGLLTVGNLVPMQDQQGNRLQGKILEVGADYVRMDFNDRMAGATLHFTGKVEAIREATEEELTNGLFGERACGCGCGCDADCDCGCQEGGECHCGEDGHEGCGSHHEGCDCGCH